MIIGQPFNPYKLFVGSFLPNALLEFPGLTPSAKIAWARLAQFAGKNGKAHPKIATLAIKIGLSERQTRRVIEELEVAGFLRTIKATGQQRLLHFPDTYAFTWHPCFTEISNPGPDIDGHSGLDIDGRSNTRESLQESKDLPCVSGEAPSHSEVVGLPQVASRKKAPADPNVKLIIDHYYTSYLARFKSPPPIAGGKCGSVAKRLLSGRSLDDAKWLITAHLARAPEMYERKNLYGLEHVLSAAPILLARRAKERGEDE